MNSVCVGISSTHTHPALHSFSLSISDVSDLCGETAPASSLFLNEKHRLSSPDAAATRQTEEDEDQ